MLCHAATHEQGVLIGPLSHGRTGRPEPAHLAPFQSAHRYMGGSESAELANAAFLFKLGN
jgi:hypothetical protein